MSSEVDLIIDAKALVGEGPIWHSQKNVLYWVDILGNSVNIYDPATDQNRTIDVGQPVGTIVPRKSGGVMLALHHGFASLNLETEEVKMISDPESHIPEHRFNDGKCDPAGRFWAGTMTFDGATPTGSVYCMFPDLRVKRMIENVSISNGIVWSLDNSTMYYIDTPTNVVVAYDYNIDTADISNKRVAITIPQEDGMPDGMTIDSEGMLWIAHYGGSRVTRWDANSGKLLQTIPLPVTQVTACALGGPKMDQLYITSACQQLDDAAFKEQPHAGGLIRTSVDVKGIEAPEFAG